MPLELHTIETVPGAAPPMNDRIGYGLAFGVAYGAGGGAGQSVTINITGLTLPPKYMVDVELNVDACAFVTNKTATGFSITITPRLAANTLASGTLQYQISY
jgi:hypothetical protein